MSNFYSMPRILDKFAELGLKIGDARLELSQAMP
jgi:hypothetical protein